MDRFQLPAGVRDILPDECARFDAVQACLRERFAAAGFRFVRPAGLEYFDTFAGADSPVAPSAMFKMTDRDGNLIVLRPDMTLACARIAASKLGAESAKLCYFSDVYDFSAAGNSDREIAQAGVEVFGEAGAEADAAVIGFAVDCLEAAGLSAFIVDIGHVGFYKGILEESGLSPAAAEEVRACINAKDAVGTELALRKNGASQRAQRALLALPSLFGDAQVLSEAEKLTDSPAALASLSHLKQVYALLCRAGKEKRVSFDLGTVKSLAYYSGAVFTGLAEGVGAPVLSGGRYDGLCARFGKDLPAAGFAIGMQRVLRALERDKEVRQ